MEIKFNINNYDFPINIVPIMTKEGIIIPNRYAVLRTDTKNPLGIISNKYKFIRHKDVIDSFRKVLREVDEYQEQIQVAKGGAHLFATYKIPRVKIKVQKGDLVALQFIVKNSYDGTNSLQIILGAFRLVCSNGMVIGKQFFSYSQRHIGLETGIRTDVLKEKISFLVRYFKDNFSIFQQMSRQEITHSSVVELFTPKLIKLPKYLIERAMDIYESEKDRTVWGFYNSLTMAITHHLQKKSPQATINYGARAWKVAKGLLNNSE